MNIQQILVLGFIGFFFAMFSSEARPAFLIVDSRGQLIGAKGVEVDGSRFDVEFIEGSCVSIFTGCDDASDFDFKDQVSARLAAQALLEQVFLDVPSGSFDSFPELTLGCTANPRVCQILIPYAPSVNGFASGAWAENDEVGPGRVGDGGLTADSDTTGTPNNVYVRFTRVDAIEGTVTSMHDGLPLPKITIGIFDYDRTIVSRVTTKDDGTYSTGAILPPGTYFAQVLESGRYVPELYDDLICDAFCPPAAGAAIVVTGNEPTKGIDFSLERGWTVSGKVFDAVDGRAVSKGAVLILTSNLSWAAWGHIDPTGHYETARGLPPGQYFARVGQVSGYLEQVYDRVECAPICIVNDGAELNIPPGTGVLENVDFALRRGGSVSGAVRESGTGNALPRVTVQAFDERGNVAATAVTDANGQYRLEPLSSGVYFVGTHNSDGYEDRLTGGQRIANVCDVSHGDLAPELVSPRPSETLPGTSVTFQWRDNGARVARWHVNAGKAFNGVEYHHAGAPASVRSVTMNGLPGDGSPVYLRLWWWYRAGGYGFADYEFRASAAVPLLRFSESSFEVTEEGVRAVVTVLRGGNATGPVSVRYATANGSALAGVDYQASSGTLAWLDGESGEKRFEIALIDDSLPEGARTATIALSNPTGGAVLQGPSTATLTIMASDIAQAEIFMPPPGEFAGADVTLRWRDNGAAIERWYVNAGKVKNGVEYLNTALPGSSRSIELSNLPTDRSPVHVRLWWWYPSGGYAFADYQFAAKGPAPRFTRQAVVVTEGATTAGVDLDLERSGSLVGPLGDEFGLGAIESKIWNLNTRVRRLEGGVYTVKLTRRGLSSSNTLSLANPDDPYATGESASLESSLAADVRIVDVCNIGSLPHAGLVGYFYNDGTSGESRAGEVAAGIDIRHNGESLEVIYFVERCPDDQCDYSQRLVVNRDVLGPAMLGGFHRLSIDFDGEFISFGFDQKSTQIDVRPLTMGPILPSKYFERTGRSFKGLHGHVSGNGGPHEGAHIMAEFDNVTVNGESYDDFSTRLIDPSKWNLLEFGREVVEEAFVSTLRRRGSNGSNTLSFQNPDAVSGYAVDVTVEELIIPNTHARARLTGFFYNVGTEGESQAGEIQATLDLRDSIGGLQPVFFVGHCINDSCSDSATLMFNDTFFKTVQVGETHRLGLFFDSGLFTFSVDGISTSFDARSLAPFVRHSQLFQRTGNGFKGIGTRIFGIDSEVEEGYISARFDNLSATIEIDPDNDGRPTSTDNCPFVSNSSQIDGDLDGVGDSCDAFPSDERATRDADNDGMGDAWEVANALNTTRKWDASRDPDGDKVINIDEFLERSDPEDPDDPFERERVSQNALFIDMVPREYLLLLATGFTLMVCGLSRIRLSRESRLDIAA